MPRILRGSIVNSGSRAPIVATGMTWPSATFVAAVAIVSVRFAPMSIVLESTSVTCARDAGSEDRPTIEPCRPRIAAEKFGSTEWSVKSAAPSRISTRLMRIGMPGGPDAGWAAPGWSATVCRAATFADFGDFADFAAGAVTGVGAGGGLPAGRSTSDTFMPPFAPMITRP